MPSIAPQIRSLSTDELRNISIDMTDALDESEVLVGTPQVQSLADFVSDNAQVNSAVVEINGRQVSIGKAVQFSAECDQPGAYNVEVVCETSAGQEIEARIRVDVQRSLY
jgi:hypothetical protein